MTPNRTPFDDFEFPTGGLAEEVAAATAVRERDEANENEVGPTTLADVEVLFLAPDETAERAESIEGGIEHGELEQVANAFPSPENVLEDESAESGRPRTVEEALASDFLFAFDQREEQDGGNGEPEASASCDEPPFSSGETDQGGQDADVPRSPTDEFLHLTLLDEGREELEREIGNLRRELERHRTVLLELREGSSPLLPAPTARRPGGSHLPATADVLAGMTTVAEPVEGIDFRDTEEFRATLPKAGALLGLETAPDGTLLRPIDDAEEPTFRALAPIERPRERHVPLLECQSSTNLPAVRPLAVGLARADVNDVEAPAPRQTDEIVLAVRWWNAIAAVGLFALLATGLGFLAVGMVGQVNARVALQDALHSAPIRVADLEASLAGTDGTFLARFDGRFDYVRARVQDFVNVKNNAQELLTKRQVIDPRVVKLVERAVDRVPAIGWQRLTRAALATAAKADEAEAAWTAAAAGRIDDPLYWEMLGDHYRMAGRKDEALAMFANVLRRRPAAAREVMAMLAEVRIDLAKSLAIIPPAPVAALQAVLFVRNEEGRREWRTHAEQLLERLGAPKASEDGDDLAARGQLLLLLGKGEEASATFELALKQGPERNDFRIALAKLRYEQKRYEECAALAEKIIQSDPASGFGEEARVLRNKIELATSGQRAVRTTGAR